MTHHCRHHRNWLWLVGGVGAAGLMAESGVLEKILPGLHNFGYLAAPVAGLLFTSTFTVASGWFLDSSYLTIL
jgi:hypothetical protein